MLAGLDIFLGKCESFRKRNAALIVNHTSVTSGLAYSWDELLKNGIRPVRIFSPEHGLFGVEQDQAPVVSDKLNGIPLTSLYGSSFESLSPDPELLAGIDCVIFDIQDAGSRYYTYAATLILFMRAINGSGIELIVLDRPNPIGGMSAEGPLLEEGYESFVGLLPVPVRHALTMGETALFAKNYFRVDVELKVIKMEGWRRGMYFDETGLPWVPPSPNMPSVDAALAYPGMCLLEGTNISEGRGTTNPFLIFGAPFADPYKLLANPALGDIKGASLVPFFFKPAFNKYRGELCGGFFVHIRERSLYEPFRTGVAVVKAFLEECPRFEFLHGVYEFNSVHPTFDLLCGSSKIRGMISGGSSLDDISETWKDECEKATNELKPFYLYGV